MVDKLGLSYKNVTELNSLIDKLPKSRPPFKCTQVIIQGESMEMYSRDIIQCIRALFEDPECAEYMIYAPERHYADKDKTIRLYHDMHTGQWWWKTQVRYSFYLKNNY